MSFKNIDVLILCGGKGERLAPITSQIPKPLVKIKGKPIINYLISYLENFGFRRFIIAVGYKSQKMREYFHKNHKHLKIDIIDSGDVDIIQRLVHSSKLIKGNFIVCYGDTLADVNLMELIKFHDKHLGKASVTCYQLRSQFGILSTNKSGIVESFEEKPLLDAWMNIGYFYFDSTIFHTINNYRSFVDFLQSLIQKSELFSFKHSGIHLTINTIKELAIAEKNIDKFKSVSLGRKF